MNTFSVRMATRLGVAVVAAGLLSTAGCSGSQFQFQFQFQFRDGKRQRQFERQRLEFHTFC